MIKMLLVGELNDTLHSLSECLIGDFQVQMCSENAKNVKDMVRILRPAILVFNIVEINEDVKETFETLKVKLNRIPMLIIGTYDMHIQLNELADGFTKKEIIYRPLKGTDVLMHCYQLLNIGIPKNGDDTVKSNVKKKILIVDDNALVLRKMKSMLEKSYDVLLANSGEKGLICIKNKKPDLVMLDYDMPGMDGKETFERIKKDEELQNIPIIFLTSVAEKKQILAVLKNMPDRYILKPPSKDKIISAIKEALGE